MSQHATRPQPPPSACPCTRATTGAGQRVDRVEHRAQPQRVGDVLVVRQLDRRAHPVDVRAGRERRAVAREHDRARVADVGERRRSARRSATRRMRCAARAAPSSPAAPRRRARSAARSRSSERAARLVAAAARADRDRSSARRGLRPAAASSPDRSGRSSAPRAAPPRRRSGRAPLPAMTTLTSSWPDSVSSCSRPSAFGGQLEPVDAERLDAELAAQELDRRRPGRAPSTSCDVDHRVAHGSRP